MGRRRARDLGDAGRGERSDLSGAEQRPGREQRFTGSHVAADRPDVRSDLDRIRHVARCCLFRQHSRSAQRRRLPRAPCRRSRSASPPRSPAAGRRAHRRRSGRRPASSPGRSPARTAKPSIAELGNGGRSTARATSSASTRPAAVGNRDGLRVERPDPREHSREGFVDGEQRRHRAHTLTRVISVIVPVHDEERSVALLHDELASALEPLG